MSSIAFIDFDGTIYKGDSMLDFIRFCLGNKRLKWNLFLTAPQIVLKKLGVISSQIAKEKLLRLSLGGMNKDELQNRAIQFSLSLDEKIYPKAKQRLKGFNEDQIKVVIVSASCELWLKDWCEQKGYELIASIEEYKNNKMTGKLFGKNCKGIEKEIRIKAQFNLDHYDRIYAYGNDSADKYMINLANQPTEALYE